MNNLPVLLSGELQRMQRYNILTGSFVVALFWVGALHFLEATAVTSLLAVLLLMDAVTMPILLVGVAMFFERQEGALKSMLVAPISKAEYILAKVLTIALSSVMTLALLYLYVRFYRGVSINVLFLGAVVVIVSAFHSLVGFLATYTSRDFTSLLMRVMVYFFVLGIPILLEQVGLIASPLFSNILYLLPTKAAMELFNGAMDGSNLGQVLYGLGYFATVGLLLYRLALRKFEGFAEKESGV